MQTDPRIDSYIAGKADFAQPVLTWIRQRMHAALPDGVETIKWGMPFFTLGGRPFANMVAFKAHARFGFWNGTGMENGQEHEPSGRFDRLASIADLPDAPAFEALIRKAAAKADSGTNTPRPRKLAKPETAVPQALAEALAGDALAADTFTGFPPSCRREYCDWIAEAKRPETRDKRVAEAMAMLRAGKRRHWKYESC